MGVWIKTYKVKEKASDKTDNDTFEEIESKYNHEGDIVERVHESDFISPFTGGIYVLESVSNNFFQMSYSGYGDFIQALENIREESNDISAFGTTLRVSGIDGSVSYQFAEEILHELEEHREDAEKYFFKSWIHDDWSEFMMGRYCQYIRIAMDCVECKGIINYS